MAEPAIFVVHEFSVRAADQAEVDTALARVVAHIRDDPSERGSGQYIQRIRLTVAVETPARAATSWMVVGMG